MLDVKDESNDKEITCIIDHKTGALTLEGLTDKELEHVAFDVLPKGTHVNCARPADVPPLQDTNRKKVAADEEDSLYIFRIYHGSVVEGPGRRSVIQFSGCDRFCVGCFVPETHRLTAGVRFNISDVVQLALDPVGEPRDGVTILGGEPFMQPDGLAVLMRALKKHEVHITVYSGYTLEELRARPEPGVHESLALADILIDGRFVAAEAQGAGEWRGSRNQRIIYEPARA